MKATAPRKTEAGVGEAYIRNTRQGGHTGTPHIAMRPNRFEQGWKPIWELEGETRGQVCTRKMPTVIESQNNKS